MSKLSIPFSTPDISGLARSLRAQIADLDHAPGHLELLNMLARATGHRNFQHLRAGAKAQARLATETIPEPVDHDRLEKVLRHFDDQGRMLRWPARTNHQTLCLWAIWSAIPAATRMSEAEVNRHITEVHTFGDHAILRRSLVNAQLLVRTPDGRLYRRIEQKLDADGAALIAAIERRR